MRTCIIFFVLSICAHADVVVHDVFLEAQESQIIFGGFGSGVFWRPTFDLEPFTLEVGDTVEVTVHLDRRVIVTAGSELESAGVFVTSPSQSFKTTQLVDLEFLDVEGDLLANDLSFTSNTEGGIGGHTGNSVDLTDTSFSFRGFHYSIEVISGTGFPGTFTEGTIAVQTQGTITIAVPEPSAILFMTIGLAVTRRRHSAKQIRRIRQSIRDRLC